MKDNRIRENLLQDIREALIERTPKPSYTRKVYSQQSPEDHEKDLSVAFTKKFVNNGGLMSYCLSQNEIFDSITSLQKKNGNETLGCSCAALTDFLNHIGINNNALCERSIPYSVGITLCETLIADQGNIVISSNQGLGTNMATLPPVTIILAFTSQIVENWEKAIERIKSQYTVLPDNMIVSNPGSYSFRNGIQKMHLVLIDDGV